MPILKFSTYSMVEMEIKNLKGERISSDKSKTTNIQTLLELSEDLDKISFSVVCKVPKKMHKTYEEAIFITTSWLQNEFCKKFENSSYWNFFETHTFDCSDKFSHPISNKNDQIEMSIELSEQMEELFKKNIKHLNSVKSVFMESQSHLIKLATHCTSSGFKNELPKALELFNAIESIINYSVEEHQKTIIQDAKSDFEELARRVDMNNHNYKVYHKDLISLLNRLSFPVRWKNKPILLHCRT